MAAHEKVPGVVNDARLLKFVRVRVLRPFRSVGGRELRSATNGSSFPCGV